MDDKFSPLNQRYLMVILFPTVKEMKGALGELRLAEWKYGIMEGHWKGRRVFIIGVSKSNAAFASGLIFSELKPEKALLAGICGAYRKGGLKTGELVSIVNDTFADEALFFGDDVRLLSEEGFPVCKNNKVTFEKFDGIKNADSNTVSLLSSVDELADIYYTKTKAEVENMEGAAVGLSALACGVSVYQIRAVSNYCGNRQKQEWSIKEAFGSLNFFFQSSF
jgi:futalosine hydrolase